MPRLGVPDGRGDQAPGLFRARSGHDFRGPIESHQGTMPLTCTFLVVGTGVDPVTSRFSGARSTN